MDTCNKTIDNLDSYKIGTILDYSVEGKNKKVTLTEFIGGDFYNKTCTK